MKWTPRIPRQIRQPHPSKAPRLASKCPCWVAGTKGGMSVASFSMADTCFGKLPLHHHQTAKGCCERVTKIWGLTLWRESPGIQIQGIPWTGGMAPRWRVFRGCHYSALSYFLSQEAPSHSSHLPSKEVCFFFLFLFWFVLQKMETITEIDNW